jgi:hypothetical protein
MQHPLLAQMRKSEPGSRPAERVMPGWPPFPAWHNIAQLFVRGPFTLAHWDLILRSLAQHLSLSSQQVRLILRKACAARIDRHGLAQRISQASA